MNKTILTLAMAIATLFGSNAIAQNKIGYIDFQELMQLMPEYKKASADMELYGKTLQDELKKMSDEFDTKLAAYQKQQATMSDAIKDLREKELRDMQTRIQEFQESAQENARKREQELLKPIIEKAKATIATVAKESGLSYILDSSPGSPLLFKPDGDNVLPLVKKKLGIL